MKHLRIASLLSLLATPAPAPAAEGPQLDYWALSFFLTINFLVTAGLFGVGILLIGIFYDRFKPWLEDQRSRRRNRKHPA